MCECISTEVHAGVIYGLHTGDYNFRYIGQTVQQPHKRLRNHFSEAKTSTRAVAQWLNKHGEDVQMCIIETFTADNLHFLDAREVFHIAQNETLRGLGCGGLNHTVGGQGSAGHEHTAATREKMSVSRTGVLRPNMYGNTNALGYKHTDEARKVMSEKAKGRQIPEVTRLAVSRAHRGKKHSPEHIEKSRAGQLASPVRGMGAHNRWHVSRSIVNPDCAHCAVDTQGM